tara:strand:+ start:32 stop:523 length:492 start_codon:yes stop_codon:yes gene_type:complete
MVIGTLAIFSVAGGGLVSSDPCHGLNAESDSNFFNEDGTCNEPLWDEYAEEKFEYARTVSFAAFIMFQLFNVVNCRSIDKSAFELGLFKNVFISASFMISLFLLVIIVQNSNAIVPIVGITIGSLLHTIPLQITDWLMVIVLASSVFWIEELRKIINKIRSMN